jgi:hypothetical protein
MFKRKHYYRAAGAAPANRHEVYRETVVDEAGTPVQRTVVSDVREEPAIQPVVQPVYVSAPRRAVLWIRDGSGAKQILWYVLGLVNGLLALRFVLLLLGANPASPFVRFIYGLSLPFVFPFLGIFEAPALDGSLIEWASVVAILVYLLLAYAIARTIDLWYARAHRSATPDVW